MRVGGGQRANAKGKPRTALSTLLQQEQAAGLHIRDVLLNNDNDVASEAKNKRRK